MKAEEVIHVYDQFYLLLTHLFKWRRTWIYDRSDNMYIYLPTRQKKLDSSSILSRALYILNRGSNRRWLSKVKFIGCMYTSSISIINTQTTWTLFLSPVNDDLRLLPCSSAYRIDQICYSLQSFYYLFLLHVKKGNNSSEVKWLAVCIYLYLYTDIYTQT
jgi:hypothetical protein